ncbi:MAG: heavy metal translocating P-type ATPase [Treponema sp.]|jgi:Cd2+/Zn2+-exporting ATPase|nr:heavy metal translocating P-type ATPase [Treponema sp.]
MTREFTLRGLECPHCAARIEADVHKLAGVLSARVNLMTTTLTVTTGEPFEGDLEKALDSIVRRHEPGTAVFEKTKEAGTAGTGTEGGRGFKGEREKTGNGEIARIITGGIFFAMGFGLEKFISPSVFPNGRIFTWLLFGLCAVSMLITGCRVIFQALRNIARGALFDENFLMTIATAAAFAVGEYPEAAAVMLFYRVGEYFQDYAVGKSRRSIAALTAIRPDRACVIRGGVKTDVKAEDVSVGEHIEVKPGERIPLDGIVIEGRSFVDTSALTGESVPREAGPRTEVSAGSVNTLGVLLIETTKAAKDSAVSRILDLVQYASGKKSRAEKFITRFAKVYTPIVTSGAFLLAVIPPLFFGGEWNEWIRRSIIFLVVSCPCALVISVPLGFFGGIGAASRRGILIKGGNYLELLAKTTTAVFDKTGTLTRGVFNVSAVHPAHPESLGADELLAAAAHAEQFSNHPISSSLQAAHSCEGCGQLSVKDHREIPGKGVSVTVDGVPVLAGTLDLLREKGVDVESGTELCMSPAECAKKDGGTIVHISENGRYTGHIVISDEIKADAKNAISALKRAGVKKTVLLTGDTDRVGRDTAAALGIDECYTELLPSDKVEKVEALLESQTGAGGKRRGALIFVGDGINDAPVLARSDVGVAMGGLGSDAAIEAADAVIMSDEPSRLAQAIVIARKTMGIVKENIVFSLGVKAIMLGLGAAGLASMWLAVFADVGVTFLAVLNSLRLLSKKA